MKVAKHENVRLMVSQLLLNIFKKILEIKIKFAPDDLRLNILKSFMEYFKDKPTQVILLMPQEIRISQEDRYRIDTVFEKIIAFDFKSYPNEFDEAYHNAKNKYLTSPFLSEIKYYVITNWDFWKIYKVERKADITLISIYEGEDVREAEKILSEIISNEVKELKVPPYPASIEALFTADIDKIIKNFIEIFNIIRNHEKIRPLFETYRNVMELLYRPSKSKDDERIIELYIKHTIMHMIAMACLSAVLKINGDPLDLCSGTLLVSDNRSLDVSLPYLNWWKIIFQDLGEKQKEIISSIAHNIVVRSYIVDWKEGGDEDIFRRLYEILVEAETRRRIGEYYTPLWVVDRILNEFTLKDKLVMDPFCGSGTFLVRAFYKKIQEGEDKSKAYEELIGFDVNPLAVTIARAELIIAYYKNTGLPPSKSPHVYHADTLAMWFIKKPLTLTDPEYLSAVNAIVSYITAKQIENSREIYKIEPESIIDSISRIERLLTIGIRLAIKNKDINIHLKNYLLSNLRVDRLIERLFRDAINETEFINRLGKLIEKYGDGIWAIAIVSALIPSLAYVLKPHVIVTNPPWVPMTEYQAGYANDVRDDAMNILIRNLKIDTKKAASIITGSDIACMALYKALERVREGLGFVMNRDQSFNSKSSMSAGILLTYAIIREMGSKEKLDVKLIDIDYDAFGHGIYPSVVIVKKSS